MRDFLKWTWRGLAAALLVTVFINNLAPIQIGLLIAIVALRVIIVETDKTVY
jgi:hypothetical protein